MMTTETLSTRRLAQATQAITDLKRMMRESTEPSTRVWCANQINAWRDLIHARECSQCGADDVPTHYHSIGEYVCEPCARLIAHDTETLTDPAGTD